MRKLCDGCNKDIKDYDFDLKRSESDYNQIFESSKDEYEKFISRKLCAKCSCEKRFCYNCCLKPHSCKKNQQFYHENTEFIEISPYKSTENFLRNLYYKDSRFSSILDSYKSQIQESYSGEIVNSIQIVSKIYEVYKSPEILIFYIEKLFMAGFSTSAFEVIFDHQFSIEDQKKIISLILRYTGFRFLKKLKFKKLNEMHRNSINDQNLRYRIIYSCINSEASADNSFLEYQNYIFNQESIIASLDFFSDRAYFAVNQGNLAAILRFIHFSHIFYANSIILSNAYLILSDYFKKSKKFEEAAIYAKKSIEIYLQNGLGLQSPDIVIRCVKLAKLYINSKTLGAENLLIHAFNVCETFKLDVEILKVCKWLKIYYETNFNSQMVKNVKKYMKANKNKGNLVS